MINNKIVGQEGNCPGEGKKTKKSESPSVNSGVST